ncbi:hydroxyacid dehydrogenase [Candidatus Bathyarchaeota archaeon]|nr:hydroxyacid dehydrogenase [Candidatus Bathyarchaeota archaeon]
MYNSIVFADSVYMTEKAMRKLSSAAKVVWTECESERELIEVLNREKAKVVVSEYFPITSKVVDSVESLRGIVVYGVGYDHVDVEAASERGIYVANARGANAESVAEHVFAMILAFSRKLFQTHTFVREGRWKRREESGLPESLTPSELEGKTLGIIGFGAIGSRVGAIAKCFGMQVLVYDPYVSAEKVKNAGAEQVSLEELMRSSDYVTLHCVLSDETSGMIGEKELRLMKPTAYLINASRGGVIVEEALIKALKEGWIAGAGLDVFAEEPLRLDNPLLGLDNVIFSPHIAGGSREALERISLTVCDEALRILRDEVPVNLVNRRHLKAKGYKV